jgi:hypothetical protein
MLRVVSRLGSLLGLSTFFAVTGLGATAFADAAYTVKVEAPPVKKAEKAKARIHITPGAGFHMNKEYPTSIALTPPAGVTLEKPKLTAKDAAKFEEAGADFDVVFTASDVGKKDFTGELKFAVCSANSCDPKREKIAFTVEVK